MFGWAVGRLAGLVRIASRPGVGAIAPTPAALGLTLAAACSLFHAARLTLRQLRWREGWRVAAVAGAAAGALLVCTRPGEASARTELHMSATVAAVRITIARWRRRRHQLDSRSRGGGTPKIRAGAAGASLVTWLPVGAACASSWLLLLLHVRSGCPAVASAEWRLSPLSSLRWVDVGGVGVDTSLSEWQQYLRLLASDAVRQLRALVPARLALAQLMMAIGAPSTPTPPLSQPTLKGVGAATVAMEPQPTLESAPTATAAIQPRPSSSARGDAVAARHSGGEQARAVRRTLTHCAAEAVGLAALRTSVGALAVRGATPCARYGWLPGLGLTCMPRVQRGALAVRLVYTAAFALLSARGARGGLQRAVGAVVLGASAGVILGDHAAWHARVRGGRCTCAEPDEACVLSENTHKLLHHLLGYDVDDEDVDA
jgi:hypothetical protein